VKNRKYRTLRVLLHSECNFNCFYCDAEGYRSKYTILNSNNVELVARKAKSLFNIERIKFSGGEPFAYKDFSCLFRNSLNDLSFINSGVITNGSYFDEIIEVLSPESYKGNLNVTLSLPALRKNVFMNVVGRPEKRFHNVMKSLDWMIGKKIPLKINCVLAKGVNDGDNIVNMIETFKKYSNIELRFLELKYNRVNKSNLDLNYHFSNEEFRSFLDKIGYKVIEESRGQTKYYNSLSDDKVVFIKSFCDMECDICPDEKSSLWLTPDGLITNCIYKIFEQENFQQILEWDDKEIEEKLLFFN